MNKNPIPKGIRLTEEEQNMITTGLTIMAQGAENAGKHAVAKQCLDLAMKVDQQNKIGAGMPADLQQAFQKRIQQAMEAQDMRLLSQIFAEFLAASIRLDQDPATTVAKRVMDALAMHHHTAALRQYAPPVINDVRVKLGVVRSRYEGEDWFSSEIGEVLDFFDQWLQAGVTAVHKGKTEPWAGDEDVQSKGN